MLVENLREIRTRIFGKYQTELLEPMQPKYGVIILENRHDKVRNESESSNLPFKFLKSSEFKRLHKLLKKLRKEGINLVGLEGYCEENLDLRTAQEDLTFFLEHKPIFKYQIGLEDEETFRESIVRGTRYLLYNNYFSPDKDYNKDFYVRRVTPAFGNHQAAEKFVEEVDAEIKVLESKKSDPESFLVRLWGETEPYISLNRERVFAKKMISALEQREEEIGVAVLGVVHSDNIAHMLVTRESKTAVMIVRKK